MKNFAYTVIIISCIFLVSAQFARAYVAENYANASASGILGVTCFNCVGGTGGSIAGQEANAGFKWTPATSYTLDEIYLPLVKAGADATAGQYIWNIEIRTGVSVSSYGTVVSSASFDMVNTPSPHNKSTFASSSQMARVNMPDVALSAGTEYVVLARPTWNSAGDSAFRLNGAPSGTAGAIRYFQHGNDTNYVETSFTANRNYLLFVTTGLDSIPVVGEEVSYRFATGTDIFNAVADSVQDTSQPIYPLLAFVGIPVAFYVGRRLVFLVRAMI